MGNKNITYIYKKVHLPLCQTMMQVEGRRKKRFPRIMKIYHNNCSLYTHFLLHCIDDLQLKHCRRVRLGNINITVT